jgi:hypothetical protein
MTIPEKDSQKNEEPAQEKKFSESDWLKRMNQD